MTFSRREVARASAPIGALLALACMAAAARAQGVIVNPGFEEGVVGGTPFGWSSGFPSYDVELVDAGPHGGARAVRITARKAAMGEFGNVMQSIDATPLRGKRIRLTGWVRAEPLGMGGAQLWLRVDRAEGQRGFFDNMQERPIASPEWRRYVIVGEVAPDAQRIALGMMLNGQGRAWLDDVSLEVLPPAAPAEPARALSNRGLLNLVAFSRLLGYVRFFHPSDEAAATDWNAFAVAGVRAAERAADAARLATVLDSLFRPIAPSLQVTAGTPDRTRTLAAPPAAGLQVVAWRHLGVGLSARSAYSVYRSERMRAPASPLPDSFPDPQQPFVAELGGGVRALVPLAVFADSAGTLPRGRAGAADDDALPPGAYDANDRAVRLADVALAWTVFQHFYPYFDVAGTDWNAELPGAMRAAAGDADAQTFAVTLQRLVAALRDGHGGVRAAWSDRSHIPPLLLTSAEGQVVASTVGEGATRVRRGDVLLAVDGVPVGQALTRAEALISAATPQWRRYRALNELLLGRKDSDVALEVKHPDGAREAVTLRRSVALGTLRESRPDTIAELRPGIFYLDLDRLTNAQLTAVLPKLASARGLIFDMRGYPRQVNTAMLLAHLSQTAMTSPQWHIPVVSRPDRVGMRFQRGGEWNLTPLLPYLAAPRVFLVDGRAISYAESTMGIVENYKLGEIVGETTAGTNGNVNPFTLPGGYTLSWTGMKVLKHDGSRHHGVGIAPTVPVGRTIAGIAAGRDEQLEKAVKILDH